MSQAQKTPFSTSISDYVQNQINNALFSTNLVLPCYVTEVGFDGVGNAIVTVNFDVETNFTLPPVTCPIIGSQYVKIPVQVGDTGICISASVLLGNISGLSEGKPSLVTAGNLSALVFVPISSAKWNVPADLNALLLQGKNGVVIQDMQGLTKITLIPAGVVVNAQTSILLEVGSNSVKIDATGITINGNVSVTGTITSTGDITAGTVTLETHTHKVVGVQTGGSTITTTVGSG
jgi:hypothetical protein